MTPEQPKDEGSNLPMVVSAEVVELPDKQPGININILLNNVTSKAGSSDEAIVNTEKALDLARKFEDHHLKVFRERGEAIISIKERDPDEIDKRKNNQTRRVLKYVIAGGGLVGGAGMVAGAVCGASVVVVTLSGLIGAICFATLAPLASGESVSSNDVVRVIQATVSGLRPDKSGKPEQPQQQHHGKKRR